MPARQPPPFRTPFLGKNGLVEPNVWQRFLVDQDQAIVAAAPADARFVVTTANIDLPNDTNLGALDTGYLFATVGAGIAILSTTGLPGIDVTHSVVTKTFLQTGYEALNDQTVLVNATAGATTILLPDSPESGWTATVKKIDVSANAVTIDGNGDNIDGASTKLLAAQWDSLSVISNGTNWFITAVV